MNTTTTHRDYVSSPTTSARPRTLREKIEARGLVAFTLLAYGVTWLLMIGAYVAVEARSLDDDGPLAGVIVQVAAAAPLLAALTILAATRGWSGLAELGRSLVRWRVSPRWYAFVFVGVPLLMLLPMSVLHGGELLPALGEQWPAVLAQFPLYVLGIAVFTGLVEEPGWRGYALPWANHRYAPLAAALLVSTIWAMWHLPNALFSGDPFTTHLLHMPATIVNGLVLTWVFNSTRGSLLLAMLLHGAQNATAGVLMLLLEDAGAEVSLAEYYVVSTVVFGALMVLVALATRGRLGQAEAS